MSDALISQCRRSLESNKEDNHSNSTLVHVERAMQLCSCMCREVIEGGVLCKPSERE